MWAEGSEQVICAKEVCWLKSFTWYQMTTIPDPPNLLLAPQITQLPWHGLTQLKVLGFPLLYHYGMFRIQDYIIFNSPKEDGKR